MFQISARVKVPLHVTVVSSRQQIDGSLSVQFAQRSHLSICFLHPHSVTANSESKRTSQGQGRGEEDEACGRDGEK